MMIKFLENLVRDSIFALFYIAIILFHLGGLYDSKIPSGYFYLLDARYVRTLDEFLKNKTQNGHEKMEIGKKWCYLKYPRRHGTWTRKSIEMYYNFSDTDAATTHIG